MDGVAELIQAWYMDESDGDQRLPHHLEPKRFVSLEKLTELGVVSFRLNADIYENDDELKKIRQDRSYSYMDIIEVCPEKLPNYEQKLKSFYEEHLHTDEEIRYCLEGSGYFDVRDENDGWIRVALKKGGMIVLPAGMYHRFTIDTNNYIKELMLKGKTHGYIKTLLIYHQRQCGSLSVNQCGLPITVHMSISLQGRSTS